MSKAPESQQQQQHQSTEVKSPDDTSLEEVQVAYTKFLAKPVQSDREAIRSAILLEVRKAVHLSSASYAMIRGTEDFASTLLTCDTVTTFLLFDGLGSDTRVLRILLGDYKKVRSCLLRPNDLGAGRLQTTHIVVKRQLMSTRDQVPRAFCVVWKEEDRLFAYFEDSIVLPTVASWKIGNNAEISDAKVHPQLAAKLEALFPERTGDVVRVVVGPTAAAAENAQVT